jgi:hypothetical protein
MRLGVWRRGWSLLVGFVVRFAVVKRGPCVLSYGCDHEPDNLYFDVKLTYCFVVALQYRDNISRRQRSIGERVIKSCIINTLWILTVSTMIARGGR